MAACPTHPSLHNREGRKFVVRDVRVDLCIAVLTLAKPSLYWGVQFGTGRPLPSWASLVMVALRGAQSCEHIYKAILPSRKTGMGKGGEEGGGRERVAENRNLLGPSPTSPMQHSRKSNGRP